MAGDRQPMEILNILTVDLSEILVKLGGIMKACTAPFTFILAPMLLNWFYDELAKYYVAVKYRNNSKEEGEIDNSEALKQARKDLEERLSFVAIFELFDEV